MTQAKIHSPVIVVPHYNHVAQFLPVLKQLAGLKLPLIVVDDASAPEQRQTLKDALNETENVTLVEHRINQGKGGAVISGLRQASALGYSHAVQIDADGQHCIADVDRLLESSVTQPNAIIAALPQFDQSIPRARHWGRKLTNFWVAIETLSRRIPDPMCGFRVYPLDQVAPLLERFSFGHRMAFDVQILVYADWQAIPFQFISSKVSYPDDGVSHFHYLRDNRDITLMHIKLVFGMLPRSPGLIRRWF